MTQETCARVVVRLHGHLRPALLTRVEGDRAHLHVEGHGPHECSVWCLRFRDRATGQRIRQRVREAVPESQRTGAGRSDFLDRRAV